MGAGDVRVDKSRHSCDDCATLLTDRPDPSETGRSTQSEVGAPPVTRAQGAVSTASA